MLKKLSHWRISLIFLCIAGFVPMSSYARNEQQEDRHHKSQRDFSRDKHRPEHRRAEREHRQERDRNTERHERTERNEPRQDREHRRSEQRQHTEPRRDRDYHRRSSLRHSHDNHFKKRYRNEYKRRPYHRHETYYYHTRYLAPIRHHYHPIGYHLSILPRSHVRIFVHGHSYFYFSGVYYRPYSSGYVVVRAPIGAVVHVLPIGFISFYLGDSAYYHVNGTYYLWDDGHEAYVVVEKPAGADRAIEEATRDRLYVYPKHGQSEEQQAKDRYECHHWAVKETRVDPTLDDEDDLSREDRRNYKRAISACLEGRGYTVK